jgi:chaperonin GroES
MFTPLFARVLLERETLKVGKIIIPESAEKRNAPTKGRVVACGPTCDESVKVLVGRTVLFGKFAGDWIKDGDKEIFIVQDEDILGVVE